MTDNDIIKAFKCCHKEDCDACPYKKNDKKLCSELLDDVLDLVIRQEAEIERLKAEADQIAEDYSNLVSEKDELFDEAEKLIKKAKAEAEAVKEFAERLKEKEDCEEIIL